MLQTPSETQYLLRKCIKPKMLLVPAGPIGFISHAWDSLLLISMGLKEKGELLSTNSSLLEEQQQQQHIWFWIRFICQPNMGKNIHCFIFRSWSWGGITLCLQRTLASPAASKCGVERAPLKCRHKKHQCESKHKSSHSTQLNFLPWCNEIERTLKAGCLEKRTGWSILHPDKFCFPFIGSPERLSSSVEHCSGEMVLCWWVSAAESQGRNTLATSTGCQLSAWASECSRC